MLYISEQLRKKNIQHYFIRTVNIAMQWSGELKKKFYKFSDVADHIENPIKNKDFPGKYISDQAVTDMMAFNPEEHMKIYNQKRRSRSMARK